MEASCRPRRRAAAGLALRCAAAGLAWLALRAAAAGRPRAWLLCSAAEPQRQSSRASGRWGRHQGGLLASVDDAQGSRKRHSSAASTRRALQVNEEEYLDVWDQTVEELSLDVRELLITDANIYFVGPDIESYADSIQEVSALLNYTNTPFRYKDVIAASDCVDTLEHVYPVPPLLSCQRWPWGFLMQGLTVWIDPDGYKHLNAIERDRIRKLKFPKKKAAFGPAKAPVLSLNAPSEEPLGDPVDMWMEADVHVDLENNRDVPVTKLILASIINAILDSPPKWRGWMKQAKIRGSVPADFQTPFEERRRFHSNGVSPRLNRLLKER